MAYTSSALAPRDLAFTQTRDRAKRGLFARLFDSMVDARRRQAERAIAVYLTDTGGKFTDEAEREIERRFLSNDSSW